MHHLFVQTVIQPALVQHIRQRKTVFPCRLAGATDIDQIDFDLFQCLPFIGAAGKVTAKGTEFHAAQQRLQHNGRFPVISDGKARRAAHQRMLRIFFPQVGQVVAESFVGMYIGPDQLVRCLVGQDDNPLGSGRRSAADG